MSAQERSFCYAAVDFMTSRVQDLLRQGGPGVLRVFGLTVASLGATAIAALTAFILLPDRVLLRSGVALGQQILAYPGLQVGALDLKLGLEGRIELRDIQIGAPAGFSLPLLTIEKVVLAYDAGRFAAEGKVVVREAIVTKPVVRVERQQDKLNWLVFLEQLPKGDDTEPPAGPLPDVLFDLKNVSVTDLRAFADDGAHRLALQSLYLDARGTYNLQRNQGRAQLTARVLSSDKQRSALKLRTVSPVAASADVHTRMRLDVDVSQVTPLSAKVGLLLDVHPSRIRSPWEIEPLKLESRVEARYDAGRDRASLDQCTADLDGQRVLQLQGRATELQRDAHYVLTDGVLQVQLARLAPYIRLFFSRYQTKRPAPCGPATREGHGFGDPSRPCGSSQRAFGC